MPKKKVSVQSSAAGAGANDPLEKFLRAIVDGFIGANRAAKVLADGLRVIGPGLYPIIDHLAFWTLDIDARARDFTAYGYRFDRKLGVLKLGCGLGKVYRKAGYPAILIAQPGAGKRGGLGPIAEWVRDFGGQGLHHLAVRVEDIERGIFYLEKQGVAFTGKTAGTRESGLRQTVTRPEVRDGKTFTMLELIERHGGYTGFVPGKIIGLMESAASAGRSK